MVNDARSTTARRPDRARDDLRPFRDSVGRRAALKVATAVDVSITHPLEKGGPPVPAQRTKLMFTGISG